MVSALGPVRQLLHPVENADGELFPANGADAASPDGLRGGQALMAVSVAIQMVFTLFWEKFDGALKALAGLYSRFQAGIGKFPLDAVCLPAQFLGRMSV